jgi:hypothetical protein
MTLTIGGELNNSVLTERLGNRKARRVTKALLSKGYTSVRVSRIEGKSALEIATYYEPLRLEQRARLLELICVEAGLKPALTQK